MGDGLRLCCFEESWPKEEEEFFSSPLQNEEELLRPPALPLAAAAADFTAKRLLFSVAKGCFGKVRVNKLVFQLLSAS